MYTILLYIHSFLRYIILILLLAAIIKSLSGWFGKKQFAEGTRKLNLFTLIFAHIQLLIGLGVYFMSPWVQFYDLSHQTKEIRFFTIEHIAMMVIAIAFITVGYSLSKKGKTDEAKHRRIAIFFLLALLIIFYAIPWPWSAVARGWL
jgi:uncharacterized protein YacL